MKDISNEILIVMKELHCGVMTALLYLGGQKNVSDTLRISEPLSEQHVSEHVISKQPDNESSD